MKAKRAWIRFEKEYERWEFSPTEPDYYGSGDWVEIVYFEVEET